MGNFVMRALILALLLMGAQPAVAGEPLPGAEVPPPGFSDPVWTTGRDLVTDCQHASDDLQGHCDFEVLMGVVQLRQAEPGKLCTPKPAGDMSQQDSDRWFHDRIEQPVYDWIAARPDALARPWGESVNMAALALWPCS
jgi:hypothetical protein